MAFLSSNKRNRQLLFWLLSLDIHCKLIALLLACEVYEEKISVNEMQ